MATDALNVDRLLKLPLETIPAVIAQIAAAQSTLAARLLSAEKEREPDDVLLDIEEAAQMLGVKKDWIYSRTRTLPFIVRLGRKLRYSRRGIEKYIKAQISGGE